MTNRKGPTFERAIADYLRDRRSEFIDRKIKTGAKDCGDIANMRVGGQRVTIECKAERAINLAGWVKEAETEATNDNAIAGIVIAKRKGKTDPGQQWFICTLDTALTLIEAAEKE